MVPVSAAEGEPTRFSAGPSAGHDDRPIQKDLFGFCLTDLVARPVLRSVAIIPLEFFDIREELRQESHESVYIHHIHLSRLGRE